MERRGLLATACGGIAAAWASYMEPSPGPPPPRPGDRGIWLYWYPAGNEKERDAMTRLARAWHSGNTLILPAELGVSQIDNLAMSNEGVRVLCECVQEVIDKGKVSITPGT